MTEAKYNFYFGRERDRSYKPSPIGDTLIQGCDTETIRAFGESIFSRFIDEYGSEEFNLISFGTDRPKVNYADISQNPKTYLVDSYEKMAYYVEAEAKIAIAKAEGEAKAKCAGTDGVSKKKRPRDKTILAYATPKYA